jgi:hypothetical protein
MEHISGEESDDTSSSSSGSHQSLDIDGHDLDDAGVPHEIQGQDWMVAKRQAFALRESRQSPATPQLQAEVRLLKLLTKHKAPLQLLPAIQEWARDCAKLKHDFSRSIRPRATVLTELEERFDMQSSRFTPTIVSCLPDKRPTVVCVASFAAHERREPVISSPRTPISSCATNGSPPQTQGTTKG